MAAAISSCWLRRRRLLSSWLQTPGSTLGSQGCTAWTPWKPCGSCVVYCLEVLLVLLMPLPSKLALPRGSRGTPRCLGTRALGSTLTL